MTEKPNKLSSFFHEVWRRHVLQVAVPYCIGGWLLIEVSDVVLGAFDAPAWVLQAVLIAFLVFLPIIITLAWIFDFTPAGLVRTRSVEEELDAAQPAAAAPAMALSLGESERRQVTMLSCTFNFRAGQEADEDPEFLRDAIMALEDVFKDISSRYQGHRLRSTAEGLTLVFGYPSARDDDARRAVAAGLALLDAAQRLDENHDGIPDLTVQIGIHTGLVVIDESHKDQAGITIMGQAPRFVTWLQAIAPAGCVAISEQTRELVHRFHACESLGMHRSAQANEPVEVFRVGEGSVPAVTAEALQPVGRELELAQLQARWQYAADGDGQFVLIKGEPGIGKSSLVRAFERGISDLAVAWVLPVFCSPYEQNTSLYPIVQAIRGPVLGFEPGDSKAVKWQKLESFTARHCEAFPLALPLLGRLLSLALPDSITALTGSPQHVRAQTLELLVHIIRQQAQSRPFLLIIEDLLWADPTTLEWVQMLVEEGPSRGVFLLLTARPGFKAEWTRRSWMLVMELSPLASRAATDLLRQTAGDAKLPAALIEHIIRETGGNPLYVHELTRAVLESDDWRQIPAGASNVDLSWMKIPATLKESLAARVDHLGPAKALLQLCSVLGREFDYEQLRAVSGTENEAALKQELNTIVQSELLFRRGSSANPSYTFKHILIQETAYNSLLKSKRKELHLRTAGIIEQLYPEVAQTRPALLAWHFSEAGEPVKAVAFWTQAAQQSLAAYANLEAIKQAECGIDMLKLLPDSSSRLASEIALQSLLGTALLAARGYAAPEVRQVFTRAQELCEKLGDSPQLFRVVVGLWMFYLISGDFEEALELSHTLIRIAETGKEPAHLLQARYCLGYTLYYRADYQAARTHLEAAMADEIADYDYAAQSASGDDTRAHVRIVLAHLNWHLGKPVQASRYMDQAVQIAREGDHPYGMAFANFSAAWFNVLRRDITASLTYAKAAIELADEKGFRFFQPLARFMLSWAEGRQTRTDLVPRDLQVVEKLNQCIAEARANGSRMGHSFLQFVAVQDMLSLKQCEEAAASLEQIRSSMEKTGEKFFAPEYFRLQGQLSQLRGEAAEQSIAHFRNALERARRSESKGLELRTAIDLAAALAAQNQASEAEQLLDGLLQRFAEKDDSSDFRQAAQLLKNLRKQLKSR